MFAECNTGAKAKNECEETSEKKFLELFSKSFTQIGFLSPLERCERQQHNFTKEVKRKRFVSARKAHNLIKKGGNHERTLHDH